MFFCLNSHLMTSVPFKKILTLVATLKLIDMLATNDLYGFVTSKISWMIPFPDTQCMVYLYLHVAMFYMVKVGKYTIH